jgi:hypothetical protein
MSTNSTPAHASRSHATPAAPTWSINPIDAAKPSCTQVIDARARAVPLRAADRGSAARPVAGLRVVLLMHPVHPKQTVHVHMSLVDTSFRYHEH